MNETRLLWKPRFFYTVDTAISDVIDGSVFGDCGRLIFLVDEWYYSGDTLEDLHLTYYSNIDPDETFAITNYMKEHVVSGDTAVPVRERRRGLVLTERQYLASAIFRSLQRLSCCIPDPASVNSGKNWSAPG